MNNIKSIKVFLIIVILIYFCLEVYSQTSKKKLYDKKTTDVAIDSLLKKDYFINPNKKVKILFTFKIDSLGEVHSAHIVTSTNLKFKIYYYFICSQIEQNFNLKFLYTTFKHKFPNMKYVKCTYPYLTN